jgi:hypothetical protein
VKAVLEAFRGVSHRAITDEVMRDLRRESGAAQWRRPGPSNLIALGGFVPVKVLLDLNQAIAPEENQSVLTFLLGLMRLDMVILKGLFHPGTPMTEVGDVAEMLGLPAERPGGTPERKFASYSDWLDARQMTQEVQDGFTF